MPVRLGAPGSDRRRRDPGHDHRRVARVAQGASTDPRARGRGRDPPTSERDARRSCAPPKRIHPVIDVLTDAGFSVQRCCTVLGVTPQGYYAYRRRPLSPTKMRREWLTALIAEVHADSRGTYGA